MVEKKEPKTELKRPGKNPKLNSSAIHKLCDWVHHNLFGSGFPLCTMDRRPALPVMIQPNNACESELNQSMQMKAIIALSASLTKHHAGDEAGSVKLWSVWWFKTGYLALTDW